MKTLTEFFYEQNQEEFIDVEDAKSFLISSVNMMLDENKHFGDCIKECNSCLMCQITDLLNDYWAYTKQNHSVLCK